MSPLQLPLTYGLLVFSQVLLAMVKFTFVVVVDLSF